MRKVAVHIAAGMVLAAALAAAGCVSLQEVIVTDVNPLQWNSPAGFVLPNTDTLTLRDLDIFIRCNDRFEDDTLTVRIATLSPDTLHCEESLRLWVSHHTAPAALAREGVIPYRRRVCFSRSGNYRMTITPVRPVRGVEAVGITISKSK